MSDKIYPIRNSTWHLKDTKAKGRYKDERIVVEEILVAGEHEHIPLIAKSDLYLRRVYRRIYGKGAKFDNAFNEKRLKVLKIELSELTFGLGVGNIDGIEE
jgi:hypothetical protein